MNHFTLIINREKKKPVYINNNQVYHTENNTKSNLYREGSRQDLHG